MALYKKKEDEQPSRLEQLVQAERSGVILGDNGVSSNSSWNLSDASKQTKKQNAISAVKNGQENDALLSVLGFHTFGDSKEKKTETPSLPKITSQNGKQDSKDTGLSWKNILGSFAGSGDSSLPLNNTTAAIEGIRSNPDQVKELEKNREKIEAEKKAKSEKTQAWAKEHPVMASVASVATSPLSGVDMLQQLVEVNAVGHSLPHEDQTPGEFTQNLRAGASSDMGNVGKFLYNTAMSGVDSYAAALMGGGLSWVGGAILASGAASSAMNDIKARGGSDQQAIIGGLASGVFESLFETVSIGQLNALKEMPVDGLKTLFKNLVKTTVTNASEEAATEIANSVFDTLYMKELSNYQLDVKAGMEQGLSEEQAKSQAKKNIALQVGEAALSGGLMGAGMGAVGSAVGEARYRYYNSQLGKAVSMSSQQYDAVQAALQFDPNSKTYQQASKIAAALDASESVTVTDRELGELVRTMNEEMEAYGPKAQESHASAVRAANPEAQVVSDTAKTFIDLGGDPKASAAWGEVMDRVLAGDETLTNTQLRKLNLNSAAGRAAFQQLTGIQVPATTDTKTLLGTARSAVTQAAQAKAKAQAQQVAAQAQIDAMAEQVRAAAEAAEQAKAQQQEQLQQKAQEIEAQSNEQAAQIMSDAVAQAETARVAPVDSDEDRRRSPNLKGSTGTDVAGNDTGTEQTAKADVSGG